MDDAVRILTGSGRIRLDAVKGKVDAHTGSGSIEGSGIRGPINAHTGSGSMRLEQTRAGPLDAHTGSGHVYVDHPITVHGRVGAGALVDVRTASGSVRIE